MKRTNVNALAGQMKRTAEKEPKKKPELEGSTEQMTSTGSTLLDLAITGGRVRGGGIPGGILVEAFGPSGSGKTVLLSEIAGDIQRNNGDVMFHDPEARLNKQFAKLFDLDVDAMDYKTPDTIPELFKSVRDWEPENYKVVNGIFADSLAALSTDLEMDSDEGDKMGMRRAKEFSEELRRTCRVLQSNNYLMVCSNQIRQTGNQWGPKYASPGGEAIGFYSSVRLKFGSVNKIKKSKTIKGKKVEKVVGVEAEIEVHKNSTWEPYHTAPLYILFDYGIDDIRANLQFVKDFTKASTYVVNGENVGNSIEKAIQTVEEGGMVDNLKEEVINLWEEIQQEFKVKRKSKR